MSAGSPFSSSPAQGSLPSELLRKQHRGGNWGPKEPVKVPGFPGSQPSASWDPDTALHSQGHWDVDHGNKKRTRHDRNGNPIPLCPTRAKLISSCFSNKEVWLYVSSYGLWQHEVPSIFNRIRASEGRPSVYDCPGEKISPLESAGDYLVSLLAACLFSCWDVIVTDRHGEFRVYANHEKDLFLSSDTDAGKELVELVSTHGSLSPGRDHFI